MDRSSTSTRSRPIEESESLTFEFLNQARGDSGTGCVNHEEKVNAETQRPRNHRGNQVEKGKRADSGGRKRRCTRANNQGVGLGFGPDVTKRWCDLNKITAVIRSHEVRQDGYAIEHDGLCITTFSCPNYCDTTGNKVRPPYHDYSRTILMIGGICPNAI
jgi:hypothetical protein